VLKEYKNIKLLLIGDGPLQHELIQRCEEYGIKDKVRFLGFRDDVIDLLSVTDVFVSPSLSEATSFAIMEAMGMGKPVIAANVGGNYELIDDGNDGILVPSGDFGAIANKISFLLQNNDLAIQLGHNAREKIKQNFTIEHMVKNYESLYHQIMKQ
jgi:glycosyltransferase involved in cell wall biosynthesis